MGQPLVPGSLHTLSPMGLGALVNQPLWCRHIGSDAVAALQRDLANRDCWLQAPDTNLATSNPTSRPYKPPHNGPPVQLA